MRSTLASLALCAFFSASFCLAPGCKHKLKRDGVLEAPLGAIAFTPNYAIAFDGKYTGTPVEMGGRAPNDVMDQKLFAARLGHADFVIEVEVQQVWARGRYRGRGAQYLDIRLVGDALTKELPKHTAKEQLLEISDESDLRAVKDGDRLLLFVRWAPGEEPSFRHHLMPKGPEIMSLLMAMVSHARENDQPVGGSKSDGRKAKRRAREKSAHETNRKPVE